MRRRTLLSCCLYLVAGLGLINCFGSGANQPPSAGASATIATPTPAANPPAQVGPTPTLITIAVLPVDGEDGNLLLRGSMGEEGRNILLPGFSSAEVTDPMVFRDRLVFQVEVFDPNVGQRDGAGISQVEFHIFDSANNLVYEKTEADPAYCVFGGSTPCPTLLFAQTGYRWPNGQPIREGRHLAEIIIRPQQGEDAVWRWRFWIEGGN